MSECGCQIEFLDQPTSRNPHDQLLVRIRGAVAEYERSLIAERMRRGRQQKYRAGLLVPWTRPPYGYRVDPARPRDPAGVRVEPAEAAVVAELFHRYQQGQQSLIGLTKELMHQQDSYPQREKALESSDRAGHSVQSGLHRNGLYWALSRRQSASSTISPASGWARAWRPSSEPAAGVGSRGSGSRHHHARPI